MHVAFAVAAPLLLGVVLIISGLGKIRRPEDGSDWESLGVPAVLRRAWLIRIHPWVEIGLGAAVVLLGSWLGGLAALGALALMVAYTVLIARALRQPEPVDCGCFGEPAQVTSLTLARNGWLALLAVIAVVGAWSGPLFGGALARAVAAGGDALAWILVAAASALTTWLVTAGLGGPSRPDAAGAGPEPGEDPSYRGEELEYVRLRTPAVPVTLADGSQPTLRDLALARPVVLLGVSETCGACRTVVDQVAGWREVLPEVDVRLVVERDPADSGLTEQDEPQSIHDPRGYVRQSLGWSGTPAAVLLGADGLLAGGPVMGPDAIAGFVNEIREQLHPTAN